jgi:hypothetical protein
MAWDVATGTLTVSMGQTRGEGTFAAWDISIAGIPPEAPPAQAIGDIPGLPAALAAKAPLASPAFTGTPSAPTPVTSDNSMRVATTAYVKGAINALIDAAPGALDTLNELAAALGDDPNFTTTMLNALAEKVTGPSGGVVDNEFPMFSGTTGRLVKASGHLKASVANIRSAAVNRLLSAEHIETASAPVTLADAATIGVDWDAFIVGQVTMAADRTLGNPTNIQIGTWRTIVVQGNDAAERTLSFGSNYRGATQSITRISTDLGERALIPIFGWTSSLAIVGAPLRF